MAGAIIPERPHHVTQRGNGRAQTFFSERRPDFAGHIAGGEDEALSAALHRAESAGRPLRDAAFLQRLEGITDRSLTTGKRGPKPKTRK